MTKLYILALALGAGLGLASCGSDNDSVEPGDSFTRIYDDPAFASEYDPLDVLSTEDGGYLLLAATATWNPYVIKTSSDGQVEWHSGVDEAYVNPLAKLLVLEDSVYIVCMNEVTLAAEALQINTMSGTIAPKTTLSGIQYPLSVSQTPNGSLLILGYNRESKSSTLHELTSAFSTIWNAEYAIEEDVEEDIIDHLARTSARLPFFTGATVDGGTYYFNGFSNYTLALNFVNPGSGELTGTLNGFRQEGYLSAAQHLDGNRFAVARRTFGVNTLLPATEINLQAIGNSGDLTANDFPEIAPDAPLIVKTVQLRGKPVVVYGTHTKRQQLIFYFYDQETSTLLGTQYVGMTDPYQLGNFVFTEDGGLLILAETFLIGRFSRLCLFKLSPQEVDHILG